MWTPFGLGLKSKDPRIRFTRRSTGTSEWVPVKRKCTTWTPINVQTGRAFGQDSDSCRIREFALRNKGTLGRGGRGGWDLRFGTKDVKTGHPPTVPPLVGASPPDFKTRLISCRCGMNAETLPFVGRVLGVRPDQTVEDKGGGEPTTGKQEQYRVIEGFVSN